MGSISRTCSFNHWVCLLYNRYKYTLPKSLSVTLNIKVFWDRKWVKDMNIHINVIGVLYNHLNLPGTIFSFHLNKTKSQITKLNIYYTFYDLTNNFSKILISPTLTSTLMCVLFLSISLNDGENVWTDAFSHQLG